MLLKSRASLTCFRACFLPGRAKDVSAPRYLSMLVKFIFIYTKASTCYTEQIVIPVTPLCYVVYMLWKIYPPHPPQQNGGLKCWCENNEIFTVHWLFFNKTSYEPTTPCNVCGHPSVLPTDHLAFFVNFTTFTQLIFKNLPHICRAAVSGFGSRLKKILFGRTSTRADRLKIFI